MTDEIDRSITRVQLNDTRRREHRLEAKKELARVAAERLQRAQSRVPTRNLTDAERRARNARRRDH
jgi:hypothetical protein